MVKHPVMEEKTKQRKQNCRKKKGDVATRIATAARSKKKKEKEKKQKSKSKRSK